MTAEDPRIETIRDGISEEWEMRSAGSTNPLSALDSLAADLEAAREALVYARDCISSPDTEYAPGKDIYDQHMMMGAIRRAEAALARLSAGKEGA